MQLPSAPDHCVGADLSHLREDAATVYITNAVKHFKNEPRQAPIA